MTVYDERDVMPRTGEPPEAILRRAADPCGGAGEAYAVRRGISMEVAAAAGLRFDPDVAGRPAVLAAMRDRSDLLTAVHARYLHARRNENKMLTIGQPNGVVSVLGGWRVDPLIVVEGLFDALSLAECGIACIATIGRWSPWLAEVAARRVVWAAFDQGAPGEREAARFGTRLAASDVRRLRPPERCKDWNTALVRLGRSAVERWLRNHVEREDGAGA